MKQYIDKSAVVAEIKGYISNYKEIVAKTNRDDSTWVDSVSMIDAKIGVLQHLLAFLDTLEVKEDVILNDTFANSLEISRHGNSRNGGNGDLEEAAYRYGNCFKKHFDLASMAFIKGAEWQKERMLNNAIEREVKVDAGGYPYIDATELYDYDKDKPIAKKGDKVKLIIIKDE